MGKPHKQSRPGGPKRTPPKVKHPEAHMVTDHALVRYMERVLGMDIETIRNSVLSSETKALIQALGNGRIPMGNGFKAVVRGGFVVTIQ